MTSAYPKGTSSSHTSATGGSASSAYKKPFDKRIYNYRCARNIIQDQLDTFAHSKYFFKGMRDDVHVGHLYSMANLFDDFLDERGISHWQVKTARNVGRFNWAGLDGPLAEEWYVYHKDRAELRMQAKEANIVNSRADAYHIPEVISPMAKFEYDLRNKCMLE